MPLAPAAPPLWDVFCRVIDNFGDAGVCWRLARDLAARGQRVRLWIDDPAPLAWMAPQAVAGVEARHWTDGTDWPTPGEVVIEAFGCELPEAFVAGMAAAARSPVWINLEYLSAEAYVERSHRLMSPQFSGPGRGLAKWFFYPGFTPATGGLLREPGLVDTLDALDPTDTLAALGLPAVPGERRVSVFCYPTPRLAELPARLADAPTVLLTAPGAATEALQAAPPVPRVRVQPLPWLSQPGYDRLLRSCDLNLVRGEDSFVRAQWAGRPFLWHIYPQDDGAHEAKLEAFLARWGQGAAPGLAEAVRDWMRAWSGLAPALPTHWPDTAAWASHSLHWRTRLLTQVDLTTQLLAFVAEKR